MKQCNWSGTQGLWGRKLARGTSTSQWQSMQWKSTYGLRFQNMGQQGFVYLTRSLVQKFMLISWMTVLCSHSFLPNSLMVQFFFFMSPSQHIADVTKTESCWAGAAGPCRGWTAEPCWTWTAACWWDGITEFWCSGANSAVFLLLAALLVFYFHHSTILFFVRQRCDDRWAMRQPAMLCFWCIQRRKLIIVRFLCKRVCTCIDQRSMHTFTFFSLRLCCLPFI